MTPKELANLMYVLSRNKAASATLVSHVKTHILQRIHEFDSDGLLKTLLGIANSKSNSDRASLRILDRVTKNLPDLRDEQVAHAFYSVLTKASELSEGLKEEMRFNVWQTEIERRLT